MFRRRDWFLLGAAALLALALWAGTALLDQGADSARITVDGRLYGVYPLDMARTLEILQTDGSENVVRIENGQVWMERSTCKNQLCVLQGHLDAHAPALLRARQIICLPHRVVVELVADEPDPQAPDV